MSFLKGVLTGLAIGYLTAPRSGKETREKLSQQVNDLQNQWDEGVSQVKSQIDQLVGTAQNKVEQYKNEAKSTFDQEQAKASYNDKVDETANSAKVGISNAQDALKIS